MHKYKVCVHGSCTSFRPPLWAPLINLCPQMNARQCGVVSTPAGSWASKLPLSLSSSSHSQESNSNDNFLSSSPPFVSRRRLYLPKLSRFSWDPIRRVLSPPSLFPSRCCRPPLSTLKRHNKVDLYTGSEMEGHNLGTHYISYLNCLEKQGKQVG